MFKSSRLLALLAAFTIAGCAEGIGQHDPIALASYDFGAPQQVNLCVYLDQGVTEDRALLLLDSWNSEESRYGLRVTPISFTPMPSGFLYREIMNDVDRIPLEPPCDRILYFANRRAADFAYGLLAESTGMPEVLGYVDPQTLTHGFVYAKTATASQLVNPPYDATRHELYHLLGCAQHNDMPRCYEQIQMLKAAASGTSGFFPTWDNGGPILLMSREQVNEKLVTAASDFGRASALTVGSLANP